VHRGRTEYQEYDAADAGIRLYEFERVLLFVGEEDSWESDQLRSVFRDFRSGANGRIPYRHSLPEVYRHSNGRWLYLRLTSPHENSECIA
jgi:hypothetical protein